MTTDLAALEGLPSEFEDRSIASMITGCTCEYTI